MQTRRRFLQDMALLAGAAGINGGILDSIKKAIAIEPEKGTSFLDAEHVVVLMQENRSFDHTFGTLSGVRGFNDPRALQLANGDPVWVQSNAKGEKYVPFRLDIKKSRVTWMGDLPHSWPDQTAAANKGYHDGWLEAKQNRRAKEIPLTLGYHTREDLPFYYALADAFTVCDQNFCSSLTETTPNRLHLWTGSTRPKKSLDTPAIIRNRMCSYDNFVTWPTVPELLEDHGVSWKIYQNELTVPTGLTGEAASWMGNFGDNPIEWFTQFHVRHHQKHREFLKQRMKSVAGEIQAAEKKLAMESGSAAEETSKRIAKLKEALARDEKDCEQFSPENFAKLPQREQSLHQRAFTTNVDDPGYREVEEYSYQDGDKTHRLAVPKGDVLHQFRKDVNAGSLPAVSWLVPSARFSDHPSSAWYGQWYLSEVLNILTANPEVWKKTIFILTYDENDGFYDHIPPFQAPHPQRPETGKTSDGLDTTLDFLVNAEGRDNSLGLGFRVPMIIASPWSRGGCVCSEVFDHTSVVRFIETFASHKTGKPIRENNITDWRRAICGDLTSSFQVAADFDPGQQEYLERDPFIEQIHRAQFKNNPDGYHPLSADELKQIHKNPKKSILPQQESGVRRSTPLPYQLSADGSLSMNNSEFKLRLAAGNERFGDRSAGAPFIVYADTQKGTTVRYYATRPGAFVEDTWPLSLFEDGQYKFRVHGPNGFYREFSGSASAPQIEISFDDLPRNSEGHVAINIVQGASSPTQTLTVTDMSYGQAPIQTTLAGATRQTLRISTKESSGWYDIRVTLKDHPHFHKRYSGRVENGQWSVTDPAMA